MSAGSIMGAPGTDQSILAYIPEFKNAYLPAGDLIVGRQMMTCCAPDVQYAGMIATKNPRGDIGDRDWVKLTASIRVGRHPGYDRPGPVLTIREISACEPPAEEVATFN